MKSHRVLLAVVLVVSAVAGAAVPGAATANVLDIDADNPLTTADAKQTYQDTGSVTVETSQVDMSITVAKQKEQVGIDGWAPNDYTNEYIRIDYREDISRTIRFYVPAGYNEPYIDQNIESIDGDDANISLEPVNDGVYTAVEITVDGPTNAAFAVSQSKGEWYDVISQKEGVIENSTGVGVGLDNSTQWNHLSQSDWKDGVARIEGVDPSRVAVQHDADVSDDRIVWLETPSGVDEDARTYYIVRNRTTTQNGDTVADLVLVSDEETPPAVRWKQEKQPTDLLGSIVRDAKQIPQKIGGLLDGLFKGF